jgi:5,10-methenyltetrahydrofolate synthetase
VNVPSPLRIACAPVPAAERREARRLLRARRAIRPPSVCEATDAALLAGLDALLEDGGLRDLPPTDEAAGREPAPGSRAPSPSPSAPRGLLAAYWPMPGEPDVRPAMRRWWRAGWGLLLPRVVARDEALVFLPWEPGERLSAGLLGTWEPALAPARVPDLILIPCLGFDERGYRLGYGGGFYDRSLAALDAAGAPVVAIGVAPECALMSGFEPGPHDRPLDWIVTESRRIRGRARG